jgi:hypothetical protein
MLSAFGYQSAVKFRMIHTILLVFAFVLFVLGALPIPSRINLISAGLACWVAAELFTALR